MTAGGTTTNEPPRPTPDARGSTGEFRSRMKLVGDLVRIAIDQLPEAGADSDRVGRGAYLHIIQQVVDTLEGLTSALPLDELARLSRIVAEQRRAEMTSRKLEGAGGCSGAASARRDAESPVGIPRLPARFREMIRELYGVSIDDGLKSSTA